MKIHGALTPFMHDLFQGNPDITTPEAVAAIRDYLAEQEDGDQHYAEAADMGFADVWTGFTGELRRKAQRLIKAATITATSSGITIGVFENMKLPLPEGDLSPTYADSTAIMLRKSVGFMLKQITGLEEQIGLTTKLADQLDLAVEETGDPDLTLREAFAHGLVSFDKQEAA